MDRAEFNLSMLKDIKDRFNYRNFTAIFKAEVTSKPTIWMRRIRMQDSILMVEDKNREHYYMTYPPGGASWKSVQMLLNLTTDQHSSWMAHKAA